MERLLVSKISQQVHKNSEKVSKNNERLVKQNEKLTKFNLIRSSEICSVLKVNEKYFSGNFKKFHLLGVQKFSSQLKWDNLEVLLFHIEKNRVYCKTQFSQSWYNVLLLDYRKVLNWIQVKDVLWCSFTFVTA